MSAAAGRRKPADPVVAGEKPCYLSLLWALKTGVFSVIKNKIRGRNTAGYWATEPSHISVVTDWECRYKYDTVQEPKRHKDLWYSV